jgi:hypothetical protein
MHLYMELSIDLFCVAIRACEGHSSFVEAREARGVRTTTGRKPQGPMRTKPLQQGQRVLSCLATESAQLSEDLTALRTRGAPFQQATPYGPGHRIRRPGHTSGAEVPRRRDVRGRLRVKLRVRAVRTAYVRRRTPHRCRPQARHLRAK